MTKPKSKKRKQPDPSLAPKPQPKVTEGDMEIPFPGVIRFFLGNKKRFSVTTLCGIIISLSVAYPIVKTWGKSARNGVENVLTLNVQGEIEKVKKEQREIQTSHGLITQNMGFIRESQQNLQISQHQMWSDVRALRGMKAPPTPQPIPTFVPILTPEVSDGP